MFLNLFHIETLWPWCRESFSHRHPLVSQPQGPQLGLLVSDLSPYAEHTGLCPLHRLIQSLITGFLHPRPEYWLALFRSVIITHCACRAGRQEAL